MALTPEGMINFWLDNPQRWIGDGRDHELPDLPGQAAGAVNIRKLANDTFNISFDAGDGIKHRFDSPVPKPGAKGIMVNFIWTPKEVTLHLNDKFVGTLKR